jgi:hypothetical protein
LQGFWVLAFTSPHPPFPTAIETQA